jgi:toxin ParE1/3/4
MKYKISKKASNDLEEIWFYTFENWSIGQADRYIDLIVDEFEYIAENPKSGKDYNEIRKGYFQSRVKSHFIFYKINLKDDTIEIIRVLHQQMDIDSRLND